MSHSLRDQIEDSPGYSTDLHLLPVELAFLRVSVGMQIAERELAADTHEKRFGRKPFRLLPPMAVEAVKSFHFLSQIAYEFGPVRLTPVIYEGAIHRDREEVYWRLVRPECREDVGGMHADSWYLDHFTDAEGPLIAEGERTLKCWIPLECDPGANGLAVVPDSHKSDWEVYSSTCAGLSRPDIRLVNPPASTLLDTKSGNVVLFGDRLLHEGVVNHGTAPRISCEITLVVKQ